MSGDGSADLDAGIVVLEDLLICIAIVFRQIVGSPLAHTHAVAVATLADAACIVLAEGASMPEACIRKAADEGVAVYRSADPIFETAKRMDALL